MESVNNTEREEDLNETVRKTIRLKAKDLNKYNNHK